MRHAVAVQAAAALLNRATPARVSDKPFLSSDDGRVAYVRVLPVMREAASDSLERHFFGAVRTKLAQSDAERMM